MRLVDVDERARHFTVDVYFTHLHTQSTTYIDSQYSCVSFSCVNVLYYNFTHDELMMMMMMMMTYEDDNNVIVMIL